MAQLLTCQAISKHFGTRELFHELSISFSDDEHVGLLGPNGAGKTTFLKIIAGLVSPDGGEISKRRSAKIGFLPQEDSFSSGATVETVLSSAIADRHSEPHEQDTQVRIILSKFGFDRADRSVDALSGGWRKRLALAREVIQQPDLLLLDEPTNHLDLGGIQWLEEMLLDAPFAFLAVSHDRYFLERVTNRVVELNPIYLEGYFSASGNYSKFIEKRAEFLEAQQAQQVTLANIVRREDAFLKSNSKAQRTKSKARIEEAYRLKDELRDLSHRNAQTARAGIDFDSTGRRSVKLLNARGLAKTLGNKLLFKGVSLLLSPGTRLGLLGANGSGKTTLIRILTGQLPPDEGTIERAEKLRVVVFDQKREELPREISLRQALAGKDDAVEFRGQNIHISSWAKRFLFRVDQLNMPVGELSGGEQSRILIARLMLRPADLLILDEPTNDLDIASLDVLEESLIEFPGAIVLVTHDRFMLDRVCTEILGLNGEGRVGNYSNCAQWQTAQATRSVGRDANVSKATSNKTKAKANRDGLSASERSELKEMEATIQEADECVARCAKAMEDPDVAGDHVEAQKRWEALEAARIHIASLYARWEQLEARAKQMAK
ncbi:MAG: ABC-F family ATP-binding cassette domain-containing protein [Planctomycetes bacterium]|nr:ABC-F family ATP-binding cassette domain-containing protein [Planctomycetota bacterium]MBI3834816.1 ABC-F family ATP-binding cassette domain-containing protein [Planctomycetota bacterium]